MIQLFPREYIRRCHDAIWIVRIHVVVVQSLGQPILPVIQGGLERGIRHFGTRINIEVSARLCLVASIRARGKYVTSMIIFPNAEGKPNQHLLLDLQALTADNPSIHTELHKLECRFPLRDVALDPGRCSFCEHVRLQRGPL